MTECLIVGKFVEENPNDALVGSAVRRRSYFVKSGSLVRLANQHNMKKLRNNPQSAESKRRDGQTDRAHRRLGDARKKVGEQARQQKDRNTVRFRRPSQ